MSRIQFMALCSLTLCLISLTVVLLLRITNCEVPGVSHLEYANLALVVACSMIVVDREFQRLRREIRAVRRKGTPTKGGAKGTGNVRRKKPSANAPESPLEEG